VRTFEYTGASSQGAPLLDDRQKISVVLSTAELDRFNSYCTEKGHKKSTLIRRLVREHLERESYHAPEREENRTLVPAHASGTRHGRRSRRKGG
jgi:metal-responsive CopG/Arc/MetJ family transcriptional regulator